MQQSHMFALDDQLHQWMFAINNGRILALIVYFGIRLQRRLKFYLRTFAVKTFEAFEASHCSQLSLESVLHYTVEVAKIHQSSLLHFRSFS